MFIRIPTGFWIPPVLIDSRFGSKACLNIRNIYIYIYMFNMVRLISEQLQLGVAAGCVSAAP